ncbi:hypothetical protein RhiTH_010989 [Rhizoctonia solani]
MKKLLGPDGNWHSEDKTQDASIFVGRLFGAPANTCIHKEEIGWYNNEPSPCKPVPVKALATPPAKSAPPPGNKTQKSNTATNLFKPKPPNGPHNLLQLENLPQRASQSTGKRLKPCIIRASKLVIQQPNSHAPKVALGSFAAAQSRLVTTTGQPVCPSEFPPLQAQPLYPSEPWGQLGAPAPPDRNSNLPFGPLGSHSYQQPPPPNWAPSQAPPPGCNHFDHNTGPTGPSGSGPSGSGSTAHQAPPPNCPLGSSLPYWHPSAAPAQQSGPTSQHGQFQAQPRRNKMLGGWEEPPRQNSQPIPSNAAQHNQQQHVSSNLTRSGPSSSGALLCSKSKRSSAKQKRSKQGASGNEAPAQDKDKGGMEGDEDKPIDTHKSGSSWTAACKGIKVDPNDYPIAPAHVENMSRAKVKEEVKQLKTGALHTKPNLEPGTGYFQHPLLQIFLNKNLFKFKKDIGPQFPQYFKKVTRELICFSCAIIQFLVKEWDTGVRVRSNLDFETQQKAYNTHLESHAVFLGESPGRWALIQDQLFARAFKHSSASKSAIPLDNKNVLRRKDVRSNAPSELELAAWQEEQATMDNTQQIGVNQGFEQDGEDWAEQDRLPSHGGSADNTPERQNSHYNHDNCGYKPEHSQSHQRSNNCNHIQTRERWETRNGHSERSPPRQDNNQEYHPNQDPRQGPDSYSQRSSYSQGFGNNGNRQHPQDWNDQLGHAEFQPNYNYRDNCEDCANWNLYSQRLNYPQNFDNCNERQGQGGWDYCLQIGPQHSNYNHHDSHLLQDNCHGRKDRNAVPRVNHSLSGGARNTHNQRKYLQGGSFNNGGYYQHQGTSQSRNPPNNCP